MLSMDELLLKTDALALIETAPENPHIILF
jgi:hypothetical protein